jgi:hypothetical protein
MTDSIVPDPGEHLTTGWEPDAPVDDTLKRRAVFVHASWPLAVAAATARPSRRTDRWSGAWIGDSGALTNPVFLTAPLSADDAADVVAEIGDLIPPHVPYFLASPWQHPDLRPHGLELLGYPPLMVRLPAPAPDTSRPAVTVTEASTAEHLAQAERVLIEGYPMPGAPPGSIFGADLLGGPTRVWLGTVDGEPASVAAAHVAAGAVLVEYVAALPTARGRGAGAAVTWAATLSEPDLPAVLISSDDGRPTYERMGYLALERWTAWLRLEQPAG